MSRLFHINRIFNEDYTIHRSRLNELRPNFQAGINFIKNAEREELFINVRDEDFDAVRTSFEGIAIEILIRIYV